MALGQNRSQAWSWSNYITEPNDKADEIYTVMAYWRIAVMVFSSGLLILNIIMIVKSKQYIYNTLKLFLFLELFTVVGQVIVIFHPLMKPNDEDYFLVDKDKSVINQIIQTIIAQNPYKMLACSIEAYVNLFCYNISYLFALLITLYVRKVIDNTHKYFMRKHLNLIIYVCIATALVYLPPFVLAFFPGVPYSFGPVGFQIKDDIFSGDPRNYLFYCGITARSTELWAIVLSVFNMVLIPVLMFVVHIVLLIKNNQSMKSLRALEQLNPRQWFILKSGTLSAFVFAFQFFNFIKYVLSLSADSPVFIIIVALSNIIFDFLPIVLVIIYYKRYYKKGKKLQEASLVRTTTTQSIDSREIINF